MKFIDFYFSLLFEPDCMYMCNNFLLDMVQWVKEYRQVTKQSMRTGERPTHFSTNNRARHGRSEGYSNIPSVRYHPPHLTELGENLFYGFPKE